MQLILHQSLLSLCSSGRFLSLLLLLIGAACATAVPESTAEPVTEITETPIPTRVNPTATSMPTNPPPTNTPEPATEPTVSSSPAPAVMREPVSVSYEDKTLRGTLVGEGEVAVILAPMYGQSRGSWMHFAEQIAPLGFTALAFDFPGPFGSSSGEFKFDRVQYDVLALVDYLRNEGYQRIACIGASIGADACFSAALIDPGLAGVGVVSSPVEATDEQLAEMNIPVLLVHGIDDEIGVEGPMKALYERMAGPKQYESIRQTGHGTALFNVGDELQEILTAWLLEVRAGLGNEGVNNRAGDSSDEMVQESFEAPYEDRIIRGVILGDGGTAVILAPMFDTTRSIWMPFARETASLGYTAVAFDYPGFGSSTGRFSYSAVPQDTRAVIDYLFAQGFEKVVCIGASLGANGCYDAAQMEPNLAGLVLISDGLSGASAEDSKLLSMPKLLVYGDEDEEIVDIMQAIYQSLPEPKQLEILPDEAHGTDLLKSSDTLRNLLFEFLESLG